MNNNFWSKFPYMGFSTFFVGIIVQAHGFINLIKIIIFWIEAWLSVVVKYDHFIDRLTREAFGDMTQDYSEDAIFAQLFVYFCVIIFGSILVTIGAGMCKTAGGFGVVHNNANNQAVTGFMESKPRNRWECPKCGSENESTSAFCYQCGNKQNNV